jgi:hypothetical protein
MNFLKYVFNYVTLNYWAVLSSRNKHKRRSCERLYRQIPKIDISLSIYGIYLQRIKKILKFVGPPNQRPPEPQDDAINT